MKKTKFIEISGADGSGKTTLANYLVNKYQSKGYKSKYVWIKSQHTLAFILSKFLTQLGWKTSFKNPNGLTLTRFQLLGDKFTRCLWPIIEFISILPLILFKVLLPMRLGYVIVSDRYTVDTIVSITLITRNLKFIESFLGRLLLKLIPKNNKLFLLDIDPMTVKKRRYDIEYTEKEIKFMLNAYKLISKKLNMYSIDTSSRNIKNVNSIVDEILFKEHEKEIPLILDKFMQYSIVIPTVNRYKKLERLFNSILVQEVLPLEIIIVDQSDNSNTFELFNKINTIFLEKKIELKYFYMKTKNAAKARNIGIVESKYDIVFLIDDDVVLLEDYCKNILYIYNKYSDAVGVQGFLSNPKGLDKIKILSGRIENNLRRIFYLTHFRKDTWQVMPSLNDIFPYPFTKTINTQRLQGCCSFRRDILKIFKYDENLEGWSFLEDLDLSYRINRSGIGKLYATPMAKLIHVDPHHMTSSLKDESYKKVVNRVYMFNKLIKKTSKNYLVFIWSLIGLLFTTIVGDIISTRKKDQGKDRYFKYDKFIPIYYIKAIFIVIKHRKELKDGDLNFMKLYI